MPVDAILELCDGALEEIGRRHHLFSWLRAPGAATGEWLVVDAYYPSRRIVVVCREQPSANDELYAELIPAHGLRLLQLVPSQLGSSRPEAEAALRRLIGEVELPRVRVREPQRQQPQPKSEARPERRRAPREPRPERRRAPSEARPERRRAPREPRPETANTVTAGIAFGIALVLILAAELYLGGESFALDGGHVLLAFGIALDACARTLGTIAAARIGYTDWVWACVLGGSLAVAVFARYQTDGPVKTEPAPLAGLLSLLAIGVIAIALLAAALGG